MLTDPLNNTTHYTYDNMGRMTSLQDAKNRTTAYECFDSVEDCKKDHEDPIECQVRGENTGISVHGHIKVTCIFSNPRCDEGCVQLWIRCGGGGFIGR